MIQQDLFSPNVKKAVELRDEGIRIASDNSESHHPKWNELAFDELRRLVEQLEPYPFMAEEIRMIANVPIPPSKRAWGAVFLRAAKEGLIRRVGYRETSNPLAHRTPATLWSKI